MGYHLLVIMKINMKNWHNRLLNASGWYGRWHQNSGYSFVHWAVFVLLVLVVASMTINSINSIAYEDEQAALHESLPPQSIQAQNNKLISTIKKLQQTPSDKR